MAQFNEILVGRFNRSLQKLFGMKGGPPSAQLAGEIIPIHQLATGIENRYLESWQKYSVDVDVAAVAAQAGAVRARNPSGSNVIAVFEMLRCISLTAAAAADNPILSRSAIATDLASLFSTTGAFEDARAQTNPTVVISSTTGVASLTNIQRRASFPLSGQADFIMTLNQEVVLTPGSTIQLTSAIVNQDFNVTLVWRERFLEESERA